MHQLHPELTKAMSELLAKMDLSLQESGYSGEAVKMYLAGGMAVHYHCGTRYTEDVDATFSRRLLLPYREMTVDYFQEDGSPSSIYLDPTYNDTFALLHPDYRETSVEWLGMGQEQSKLKLLVLTPLDLAVSKISRFSQQDREDILALAHHRYFTAEQLRAHAEEALEYYVGNTSWVHGSIHLICSEIA